MPSRRKTAANVSDDAPDVVQQQPPPVDREITVADIMGGPAMLPASYTSGLTPGERRARDEKNDLLDRGLWWD